MATQPTPATVVEKSDDRLLIAWALRSANGLGAVDVEVALLLVQLDTLDGDDYAADVLSKFSDQSNNVELARDVGSRVNARIAEAETAVLSATVNRWSKAFSRISVFSPFS